MAINTKYSIQTLKYIYTLINTLAIVISFREGHSNILTTLEMSGCLSLKSYIYPTTFIPAIQNYNLPPKTVVSTFSKSAKIASNP